MTKKIAILLPYKEDYTQKYSGAVSIHVSNLFKHSYYKRYSYVYGNTKRKQFLPKNFNDDIAEMNGVFDYIDFNYDQTKRSGEGSNLINEDKFNDYSFNKLKNINKLDLLKSSYTFSFVAKAVGFINMMNTFLQNKKESDDSMKEFIEPFLNCKNFS